MDDSQDTEKLLIIESLAYEHKHAFQVRERDIADLLERLLSNRATQNGRDGQTAYMANEMGEGCQCCVESQ